MDRYVIVVAGGSGVRMGAVLPKQFLLLAGKPLLMLTMQAFADACPEAEIILVLPVEHKPLWNALCRDYAFSIPHQIATGGETRSASVKNGLNLITSPEAVVAIHDGVRPLVKAGVILEGFRLAETYGSAIPVIRLDDSVRLVTEEGSRPVDRNALRSVQTPQCFRLSLLKEAYQRQHPEGFTDDASLVEASGYPVKLFEGSRDNIKITTPADLQLAEAVLFNNLQMKPAGNLNQSKP